MRKILSFLFGWILRYFTPSEAESKHEKPQKPKFDRTEEGKYEFINGFKFPTRRYSRELREQRLIKNQGCKIFTINGARILARDKKNANRKFSNLVTQYPEVYG